MFELPEYETLSRQLTATVAGKRVAAGRLGNTPHKFVWYNREHEEFSALVAGLTVGAASTRGRWLFVPLLPGYVLVFGECGGKLLFHSAIEQIPQKYHLVLEFEDGSALSMKTTMWGAIELYEEGEEKRRELVRNMRPTPLDSAFTVPWLHQLIDEQPERPKRSVKGLLTQEQLIPGLGNAVAQEIMFEANLHPKRDVRDLSSAERETLHRVIKEVVAAVIAGGGRNDEFDLYGERGGYVRAMSRDTAGQPCPRCGTTIEKMQYLGGSCYYCPSCQK